MKTFELDSVKSLYSLVEKHTSDPHGSSDWDSVYNIKNAEWRGIKGKEDLISKKFSWPEGAEKIRKMKGFENIARGKTWTTKWSWEDGQFGDGLRLMDGRKFLGTKVKVVGENKVTCIPIHVQIGENAHVDKDNMLFKTYAAMKIVDEIESMGIRTEVWACSCVDNLFSESNEKTMWRIKIKNAEDSVVLSYLATTLSPWFFRHWVFLWYMIEKKCSFGLGQQCQYDRTNLPPGTLVIEQGQALSEEAAEQCIKEQDEKFKKFLYGDRK